MIETLNTACLKLIIGGVVAVNDTGAGVYFGIGLLLSWGIGVYVGAGRKETTS